MGGMYSLILAEVDRGSEGRGDWLCLSTSMETGWSLEMADALLECRRAGEPSVQVPALLSKGGGYACDRFTFTPGPPDRA